MLLTLGLLAVAGIAAALLALLTFAAVKNWFCKKNTIKDKSKVGVLIKEKLANRNYKTVALEYNVETEQIEDGNVWESEKIDEELAKQPSESVIEDFD